MPKISSKRNRAKFLIVGAFAAMAIFAFWGIPDAAEKAAASASGPAPTFSGAPGENNCTACHSSFPVNSGNGNMTVTGLPLNYLPNQQIPVTVTVNDPDGNSFGFEMTTIDSAGQKAGNYIIPAPTPNPPLLLLQNGFVNGIQRQYVSHTVNSTVPTVEDTKSWQVNWTAPPRRVGKVTFHAAGNGADGTGGTDNDRIYTTSSASYTGTNVSSFDGDGMSEPAVFRPSEGYWYSLNSVDGVVQAEKWGIAEDIPTPGDFDGDGTTDRAVFRPSTGFWYLLQSTGGIEWIKWGLEGDIPVAGDFDGDLRTDLAVFRPSTRLWYVLNSSGGVSYINWGLDTDVPVPGDYDADGRTDVAVFRPSEGVWYINQSTDGFLAFKWGISTDTPVIGDFDGDGRHDFGVYRSSEGFWYIFGTRNGFMPLKWGLSTDIPVPGDFDGDGSTDIAVFRPSDGDWYAFRSSDQNYFIIHWGQNGDVPIPNAYLP